VSVLVDLDAGARARLARRLVAYGRDLVAELLAPLRDAASSLGAAGRGLVHVLSSRLGSTLSAEVRAQLDALDETDRSSLERAGLVLGRAAVYLPALLKPAAVTRRAALASGWLAGRDLPRWPTGAEASVPVRRGLDPALYAAVGYPVVEGRAYRADLLERVAGRIEREGLGAKDDGRIAGWLGSKLDEARRFRIALVPASETLAEPTPGGAPSDGSTP
jgi:ATP-dependent RNA helicase SUPV3L1/SUV3